MPEKVPKTKDLYVCFLCIETIVSTWHDRLTLMSRLYFSFCPFAGIGRAWFLWVNLFVGTGQRFLSVRGNKFR